MVLIALRTWSRLASTSRPITSWRSPSKPGPTTSATQVGVRVGDHDREGEQDLPFVGRQRRDAGVERQPEPVATARGAPAQRPRSVSTRVVSSRTLMQVEMARHQLERERQPVDQAAEPVGGGLVGGRDREAGVHQARTVREQRQRVVRRGADRRG